MYENSKILDKTGVHGHRAPPLTDYTIAHLPTGYGLSPPPPLATLFSMMTKDAIL